MSTFPLLEWGKNDKSFLLGRIAWGGSRQSKDGTTETQDSVYTQLNTIWQYMSSDAQQVVWSGGQPCLLHIDCDSLVSEF